MNGRFTSIFFRNRQSAPCAALILLCGIWLHPNLAAQSRNADVNGTWDLTVESQEGIARPSVTLNQEGEKISGVYRGQIGESRLEGSIKGNDISFTVTLKFQEVVNTIIYLGLVNQDSMSGTARFSGTAATGKWTAQRRKN